MVCNGLLWNLLQATGPPNWMFILQYLWNSKKNDLTNNRNCAEWNIFWDTEVEKSVLTEHIANWIKLHGFCTNENKRRNGEENWMEISGWTCECYRIEESPILVCRLALVSIRQLYWRDSDVLLFRTGVRAA